MTEDLEAPFEVPEYQRAFQEFVRGAMDGLAVAKDPVLARMRQRGRPTRSYLGRNTVPPGGEEAEGLHESAPMAISYGISMTAAEIISTDSAVLGEKLDSWADQYLASLMPQIFAAMGQATDAFGNSLDGGGQPLSWSLFGDLLERIEIDFDDDGTPRMPTMVTSPGFKGLPMPTEEEERRLNDIIEQKRTKFLAQRRHRELPEHPLRD
jgi:hypothetical protein